MGHQGVTKKGEIRGGTSGFWDVDAQPSSPVPYIFDLPNADFADATSGFWASLLDNYRIANQFRYTKALSSSLIQIHEVDFLDARKIRIKDFRDSVRGYFERIEQIAFIYIEVEGDKGFTVHTFLNSRDWEVRDELYDLEKLIFVRYPHYEIEFKSFVLDDLTVGGNAPSGAILCLDRMNGK